MQSKSSFLFLLVVLVFACKPVSKTSSNLSEKETENGLPEDFVSFYEKFHSDSIYQIAHIVFPLEGVTYNEDNEKIKKIWSQDNWAMHKNFDAHGGTFNRSYSEFGGIISEKIVDNNKISSMERRFSKMGGEWHLIYYDPIHLSGN